MWFIWARSNKLKKGIVLSAFLVCAGFSVQSAQAQQGGGLSITVSPPLYQLSVSPGETWSSGITVVNSNQQDLTVYATVSNFEASGEEGRGTFTPILENEEGTLASWVTIADAPIVIPEGQTKTIPFVITLPEDAPPGGHYAAILISNESQDNEGNDGSQINITSSVASLLFLQVEGDVVEKGLIREFSVDETLYQKPEVDFSLRFQNLGNVHIQPQGTVTVYNMWGKERGVVPINTKSDFGNVLPGSTRKFAFSWKGEENAFDFGRYRAIATLAYGGNERQSVTREVVFWVIPVMQALKVIGGALILLFVLLFLIQKYIKRALRLETERLKALGIEAQSQETSTVLHQTSGVVHTPPPKASLELKTLIRPLQQGAVDLRAATSGGSVESERTPAAATAISNAVGSTTPLGFIRKYIWFFLFVATLALAFVAASAYFESVLTYERSYEVRVEQSDGSEVTITSTSSSQVE